MSPAASQTQTQTTLLARIRCCLSWPRCGRRGKAAPCKRSRPFAPAAFPPLGGEPWLAMNSTKSQPWPSQRPAPPGAGHPGAVLGGQAGLPTLGDTLLPQSGVTPQNLRRGRAWPVWFGCGAVELPGRLGNAWRWTKALPTGRWSLWRCPPAFIFMFYGFLFCFLLCAAEREPFRQTLRALAGADGASGSAGASESGLCSSFHGCSLMKPLTSTAGSPSISCLPKQQPRDRWNLPGGLKSCGV